jgi:hypothetical protein
VKIEIDTKMNEGAKIAPGREKKVGRLNQVV